MSGLHHLMLCNHVYPMGVGFLKRHRKFNQTALEDNKSHSQINLVVGALTLAFHSNHCM